MELSYEELDRYVQQVCTGIKLIYVKNKSGIKVPLLLVFPTTRDNISATVRYDSTMVEAAEQGIPTLAEMEEMVRTRGIYTVDDQEKVDKLKSRIAGQKSILSKTVRVPARRDRLYSIIKKLEEQAQEISFKKEPLLSMSQERKATESKFLFLTYIGTLRPTTEEKYWPTEEDFQNEKDFEFRKNVYLEYIVFVHGLRQELVRYIARSNVWRIRYVTALKTGASLFGNAIKDYTADQLTLLYWSHYYQSIYDMMSDDRPPDTVIEDDQALDAYMTDWQAERSRDDTASRSQKNNKYGNNSAWDHGETLVMRSNPVHSDVEYSETLVEKSTTGKVSQVNAAPIGKEAKKTGLSKLMEGVKKD